MKIIVDTREKNEYQFPCPSERKCLKVGDYSLAGLEDLVAVERKSKEDAFGTCCAGRKRFVRELEVLSTYEYAAIVIESSLRDFLVPLSHTRFNPNSAVNSLLAWSVRYRIPVFFADSRLLAQTLTYRVLQKFFKEKKSNVEGEGK